MKMNRQNPAAQAAQVKDKSMIMTMTPEHEALRSALIAAAWQPSAVEDIRVGLVEALEHSEALLVEHETEFPESMDTEEALNRVERAENFENVAFMLTWLDDIREADAIALCEEVGI